MTTNNSRPAELRSEREGAVSVLRLDRPAVRNALGMDLVNRLGHALVALDRDPEIRAAVLTGSPPGFCSGSDLKELAILPTTEMVHHEARTGTVVRGIRRLGVPVLAAVEGFALGGGFLLAAACDLVVTASDAHWQLPEVKLGWVPPWGLHALVERVGPPTAKHLVWGDTQLSGREAGALGIADEVTEPGEALPRALELAHRLAMLPPHAVASTKRALAQATTEAAELFDESSTRMFGHDCRTETARAGLAAFARRERTRR